MLDTALSSGLYPYGVEQETFEDVLHAVRVGIVHAIANMPAFMPHDHFVPYPSVMGSFADKDGHHHDHNNGLYQHADAALWLAGLLNEDSNANTLVGVMSMEYDYEMPPTAYRTMVSYDLLK